MADHHNDDEVQEIHRRQDIYDALFFTHPEKFRGRRQVVLGFVGSDEIVQCCWLETRAEDHGNHEEAVFNTDPQEFPNLTAFVDRFEGFTEISKVLLVDGNMDVHTLLVDGKFIL